MTRMSDTKNLSLCVKTAAIFAASGGLWHTNAQLNKLMESHYYVEPSKRRADLLIKYVRKITTGDKK